MATYEEIMNAARNAHVAGDTEAAGRLVQMAQTQSSDTLQGGMSALSDMTQNPTVANPTVSAPQAPVERGLMHRITDNVIGIDDGVMSPGEKLAGFLNMGGESATFGLVGDEMDAAAKSALGRGTYDENLEQNRSNEAQLRAENPYLSLVADIGGGMAVPGAAMARAPGLLAKVATGGAVAGAGGGTFGFMEGEGGFDNRLESAGDAALLSGGLGAAVPVAGAGIARGVNRVRGNRAIRQAARNAPSPEELQAQASSLFREVDQNALPQRGVLELSRRISEEGRTSGMDDVLTPSAARAAGNLSDMANSAGFSNGVPMSELNIMRRQAGVAAGNVANRTESAVGTRIINAIDDYVDEAAPALGEKAGEARRMWGVLRRSELMDQAFERAGLAASGFENGLQIQFRQMLQNRNLMRGFSDAEKQAMRSVVDGGVMHGLLRQVGRMGVALDGGSNALGGILSAGFGQLAGGPIGMIAAPTIGTLARKGSEVLRTRKANRARDIVRTLDMPNVPQISQQGRGLLEDILLRSARTSGIAANGL